MAAAGGEGVAPVVISNSFAESGTGGITITKPSGVASGDLLVAVLSDGGGTNCTWTPAAGWTEIADETVTPNMSVAYKVAGGSEGASYAFTSTGVGSFGAGVIFCIRNGSYDVISAIATSIGAVACVPASVSASCDGSLLLSAFACYTASVTWSTPSGMTSAFSDTNATRPGIAVFRQVVPYGATGTRSSLPTGSGNTNAGVNIIIKPK